MNAFTQQGVWRQTRYKNIPNFAEDKNFRYICQRLARKKTNEKKQVYYWLSQSRSFGFHTTEAGASAEREIHTRQEHFYSFVRN